MSQIFLRGVGAVSPAGWGVAPLLGVFRAGVPLPVQELAGPNGRRLPARLVPPPVPRPAWLAHPRLRRASSISHFAVAAAQEALAAVPTEGLRLGIVTGTHAASVRYSQRFFDEVIQNPATASPLLFPETVINAPASHVAAVLGVTGRCYSLIADQTAFVQALVVGCEWLLARQVDLALILGLEEAAWSVAEALGQHARGKAISEGAGALLLARTPGDGPAVELEHITDAHLFASAATKAPAARALRAQFPAETPGELLVDSRGEAARLARAESQAWADWQGARLSPRRICGEALCAATSWQFIAAHAALQAGTATAANLSVVGGNLQAIGARLVRRDVAMPVAG